jgi:hypothetical protein
MICIIHSMHNWREPHFCTIFLYVLIRVDTKFRDMKFRIVNYFPISRNFHFISRNFAEISRPYFAKFRELWY